MAPYCPPPAPLNVKLHVMGLTAVVVGAVNCHCVPVVEPAVNINGEPVTLPAVQLTITSKLALGVVVGVKPNNALVSPTAR